MAETCGAKTRKGAPCGRKPGWATGHPGVGHCRQHDAEPPVPGELARRTQAVMGMPLAIAPREAILECIQIAAGEVAYASERIRELEAAEAIGPPKRTMVRKEISGTVQEVRQDPPTLHVWIQIRREAMDRLMTYSAAAMRLDLAPKEARDGIDQLAEQREKRRAGIAAAAAQARP